MIFLNQLFDPEKVFIGYCHDCRPTPYQGDICDCGKYNKELQELYERSPEEYEACFVRGK